MTRAGGWSTAHRLGWRADGLDGRKGGQLLSFSAAGRRHDCYFTMLVCHACRVTSVSRACLAGVHALAPCAPVQSRHATSSLVACYPFSCVSVACAQVVSCIFPVLSCEVDILHFPLLHAVLHSAHGARLVSKQLASPERRFQCLAPGGTLATREQTAPRWRGGSGALAFPPSVAWS